MIVESGMETIVALLYSPGATGKICEEICGITKLEKLLYLLKKEGGFPITDYRFEYYDYGPCAMDVYDDLEALKDASLLKVESAGKLKDAIEILDTREHELHFEEIEIPLSEKRVELYSLTEDGKKAGKKIFEQLQITEKQSLLRIKKSFNLVPLIDLIRYIYTKYPETAAKSKIRDKILAPSKFGTKTKLKPFKREEEDFR